MVARSKKSKYFSGAVEMRLSIMVKLVLQNLVSIKELLILVAFFLSFIWVLLYLKQLPKSVGNEAYLVELDL